MREKHIGLDQKMKSDPVSRSGARDQKRERGEPIRLTPPRVFLGILTLVLVLTSVLFSLLVVTNSYANSSGSSLAANDSCTPVATPTTQLPSATPVASYTPPVNGPTPTPTVRRPTPTPTPVTPTPTATPVTPTPTPTPVTPTPTDTATGTSSSMQTHNMQELSYTDQQQCTPTAVATAANNGSTPGTNPTNPSGPSSNNGGGGNSNQQGQSSGSGSLLHTIMLSFLTILGLLLCAAVGWFVFRRMLLPKTEVKLPPSGARPWSRTRSPNPDSNPGNSNAVGANMNAMSNFSASSAFNHSFEQQMSFTPQNNSFSGINGNGPVTDALLHGSGPNTQGFGNGMGGFDGSQAVSFGPRGMNGMGQVPNNGFGTPVDGFNSFSDSFIPPSPQIFAQSENSMIPPGSGKLPVVNDGGFAPASSAFNAMYGLPDDPFGGSQSNSPLWLDGMTAGRQGNGPQNFNGSQQQGNRRSPGFSGPLPQEQGNNMPGFNGFPQQQQGNRRPGFSGPLPQRNGMPGFNGSLQQQQGNNRPGSGTLGSQQGNNRPGSGTLGSQRQGPTSFADGMANLNDPYLADVIRQYSKKSQVLPQQTPPRADSGPLSSDRIR